MYQLILLILIFFSCIEIFSGKRSHLWFHISYLLMTFVAVFRYGQMDDYFNYFQYYEDPSIYMEVDILYGAITQLFKACSIHYIVFSAFVSLLCMVLAYRFFAQDCEYSCLSLLIFYCYTFLLCCPLGAFRQGICLSILLFFYHRIKDNKDKAFYFWGIVGSFIHLSFIVLLILPYLMRLKIYNASFVVYAIIGLSALAFVGISIAQFLPFERITYYQEGEGVGIWLRMGLRILMIVPVLLCKPDYGSDGYYAKAICLIGFALYCVLSFNDLVAGRLEYYFRTFLCLFAAYYIANYEWKFRASVQLFLLLVVHLVLWYKNMSVEIERMEYKEGTTVLNFPFISVFDKSELKEYSGIDTFGLDEGR